MDSPINNILVNVFKISPTSAEHLNNMRKFITYIAVDTSSSEGFDFYLSSLYTDFIDIILFLMKIIIEIPLLYGFNASLMKFKRGKDISKFSFLENDNFQLKKAWKIELKSSL